MRHFPLHAAASAATVCLLAAHASASDHLDAPGVYSNGALDINDLYAFESATDPDSTVLVLTVNPFAGQPRPIIAPESDPSPTTFSTEGVYNILVDNDGDALADVTFSATFEDTGRGDLQTYTVTRTGADGQSTFVSGLTETNVTTNAGTFAQAGLFEDPFFFDETGFFDVISGEGGFDEVDDFAGFDVSALVLEIPNALLGGTSLGFYATTLDGDGTQFDRAGRPAINTALIPSDLKDQFNATDPVDDFMLYGDTVRSSIMNLGGDPGLADTLLPDLLTYDTTQPDGYLNGRQLEDDVIDASLALLTGGAITSDGVPSNDAEFRDGFPYLAPPNQAVDTGDVDPNVIPTPGTAIGGLALLGLLAARRRRDQV